ncbi:C-type mannose receptor 2-like [Antennarius striatus]|uniref:C-type mannose receptor 2-like n=1 Tax=Antennarius striatus TaxID=241820 RepID=UPI0035B1C7B0
MKKWTQTLCLLFISGFFSFTLGSTDFHLITDKRSYDEAKAYCRELYTDLVTVHNLTVMNYLVTFVSNTIVRAWIGLETGDEWLWHWSDPDQKLDFLNWRAQEPKNNSEDACVVMDEGGKWFESDCSDRISFVCRGNNDRNSLTYVDETKSWRDAQDHCRNLSSELISINSAEENDAVRSLSGSQNIWIGLFKDRWTWSDGSISSFRYWLKGQPNYRPNQDCVVAEFRDQGKWNDRRCNSNRNFLCYSDRKPNQTSTQATLTIHPNTTSQGVTVKSPTTVAVSTSHSNATGFVTTGAATASKMTTTYTTGFMSATTMAGLTSVYTANSNVTTDQRPFTSTVQGTTNVMSTSTTPIRTDVPGNLILIKENMTWIEAMNYCRKRHIDLVHITTEYVQEQVAEKAKNATSSHVWLGLRYTCKFNFWFWSSSATSCYQNWAPGEGSEGGNDCGVRGAIETTGRQQWVGLPETEKLNFICHACAG